ncbi:MAG: PAS domain S-box protein [Rhodocyclaceae bacterium]|nr:PAS domain S-box protein [Rhodocyclaceae bacterium]
MTPSRNLRTLLLSGLVGANILVFALAGVSLHQSRQQYEQRAQILTQNIARALDQDLSSSIEKIDLGLRAVSDELERELAHKAVDEPRMQAFLARYEQRLPEVEAFRVANAAGLVILGKGLDKEQRPSWSDREYFTYLRDHADGGLQVSKPRFGRVAKQYIVGFARRYNHPDGSFAGVISAPIALDHFTALLTHFDLGPQGTVILRDADLGLVTRVPPIPDQAAGKVGHNAVSAEFRKLVESGVASATYHITIAPDGIERTLTYKRLTSVPMIAIVGAASADYLQGWYAEAYQTAGLSLGFLLLSLLSGGFVLHFLGLTMRESARNERYLKSASDGIHILDAAGRLVEANDRFCDMLGYRRDELLGADLAAWDARWPAEALRREILPKAFALTEATTIETRHRRKDGTTFDVEVNLSVFSVDGQRFLYASARDITQRKLLERTMAASEQRMELALAGADLGSWDLDIAHATCTHNARLATMLGYAPDEIETNARTFEALLHPDDAAALRAAFSAHLKGETPSFEAEYRLRHRDDHWAWVLSRGKVVERDDTGRALRMAGTNLDISERKSSEAALKMREMRLATLLASMQDLVLVLDTGGTIVESFQPSHARRPAYAPREQSLGKTYADILPPDIASLYGDALAGIITDGQPRTFEYALTIDGKEFISLATMSPMRGESEYPTGFLVVVRDITAERESQREIERLGRTNTLLLESVGEGIFGVDLGYRATFVNSAATAMLGYTEAELVGADQHWLFHHHRADGRPYAPQECPIHMTLADGQVRHEENEWFWRKDGSGFPVAMTLTPVVENGRRVGVVVVFQDITERQAREVAIRDLAFYDALTHLPNRRLLLDRLGVALPASARRNSFGAILYLDLDNFKPLNDTKGHAFGDLLLSEVAQRLLRCVRAEDTVARLGGDEFVVMLENLGPDAGQAAAQANAIAEKIAAVLDVPYALPDYRHHCTVSIGICLFHGVDVEVGELLERADAAMYQAKVAGRNTIRAAAPKNCLCA